jgi:hypothetical protein
MDRAMSDWEKFKRLGSAGMFDQDQINTIVTWFREFPSLWETVKLNYIQENATDADRIFYQKGEGFINKLMQELDPRYYQVWSYSGLQGVVIIAGIVIAASIGLAGIIWAIGYVKKQNNISALIQSVESGAVPADVLATAYESDQGGVFDTLADLVLYGALVGGAIMFWPDIKKLVAR